MIAQEIINSIKTDIDLISLIESKGISLKKNGKGHVGLCPFHDDKTPSLSVNPVTNLWQCFGCGAGGDVIRFIELFDKVSFPEAVNRLDSTQQDFSFNRPKEENKIKQKQKISGTRAKELLERTITIYENTFTQSRDAKNYLEGRGLTDAGLLIHHRIGYCDGTLNTILPDDPQIKAELQTIGILNENNYERFKDCIVFPVFDTDGNIITLYGRHIREQRHIYLPNRPTGLWNGGIIKTCPEVILVESVIDALSVMTAGYSNVISIQSANGLTEREIMDFSIYHVQKIALMLDGDEAGYKAEKRLKEKLSAFTCEVKHLPESHDPNSYLIETGAEKLAEIISQRGENISEKSQPCSQVQPVAGGFAVTYGLRKYQVIGLEKSARKLRSTVKVMHGGKLHVDTLDFYSARARKAFAQDICRIFEESPETVTADITRLITECETISEKDLNKASSEADQLIIKGKDKIEAEKLGKTKDIIGRIIEDFQTCGLIGEDANKVLGYICMTSRKLDTPLSILILSSSGAGKTALQDAITAFCPPEDLVKLTSLSGKALFYKDQASLKHKVLSIEEGDGAGEAMYAVRNLISAGVLVSETTIKDLSTGKLTTMESRVEGPTSVFFTTTNPDTDPETMSRFFVTGIDESREQTRKILAFQRAKHMESNAGCSLQAKNIQTKHHNFQRLLKPLSIKNPYAGQLAYGDERLQGRRDQPKYLVLIEAVCFLRQMQKEIKFEEKEGKRLPYVDVDPTDIKIANRLANEILGRSLDELSRPGGDLLMQLDEMAETLWQKHQETNPEFKEKRCEISFTRREIREFTGWANTRVHRYIKELVALEYVLTESGRNGSLYRYRLAYEGQGKDGKRFMLGLTPMEELE